MKYAVIEVGGKQLLVEEGKYYVVNRLPNKIGTSLAIMRVLLCHDNGQRIIGNPYINNFLKGAEVHATVLEHFKGAKKTVFKMQSKKQFRSTLGARQDLTRILIDKIGTKTKHGT